MNIRDIARLANVTPGTVSKVLNNYPDISEATRQTVLKIIEETKYTPNSNARALKLSSKIPQAGLVVEGVFNSVYNEIEEMLSIRLHNADYTIMSFHDNYFVQDKAEKFQELITYVNKHKLGGLIYIGGNFSQLPPEEISTLPCPAIFVNTVLPAQLGETRYSSVQVNHYETAYRQMNYLIQKGHTKICTVISSREDTSVYGIRADGYRAALKDNGLVSCMDHILESDYVYDRTYAEFTRHLEKHPDITAVCCMADIIVPAVLRAAHSVGKTPGKDLDIISFDGIKLMNYCVPSITTFAQPVPELVNCVYELLTGLMDGKKEHQHITFQTKLISNESCR